MSSDSNFEKVAPAVVAIIFCVYVLANRTKIAEKANLTQIKWLGGTDKSHIASIFLIVTAVLLLCLATYEIIKTAL